MSFVREEGFSSSRELFHKLSAISEADEKSADIIESLLGACDYGSFVSMMKMKAKRKCIARFMKPAGGEYKK